MAGHDLKEGLFDTRTVSEDELWSTFARVFSSKSRNESSYKYGFLKSIIDNLYNVDERLMLNFDQLFSKFGEIYWNLILKHGLRQETRYKENRETHLEQILHNSVKKYNIMDPIPYESLSAEMMLDISHQIKVKCKRYVVGALYEDTNHLFYSFSKKNEWIQINPVMYEFICKHKVVIEKINYYEWARFLEQVNDVSVAYGLLDKIEESSKRNNLSVYRQILFEEFESKNCFYCGRLLQSNQIDVDHFIPWAFIKDDKLWNLVLACPACNRKKNDKLPDGRYLPLIIKRNQSMIIKLKRQDLSDYQEQKIRRVYNWAKINGYDKTWCPDKELEDYEMDEKRAQREWDREEVVVLVVEYFKTKGFSSDKIKENQQRVSAFLKNREEIITGKTVPEIFRNYAGIHMQSGRIRCLDPETPYSGMKGTKLQKQVVQEYIDNPSSIILEAEQIYKKYDKNYKW